MRRRPVRTVRTVLFDCDSTLCRIEGIDELARRQSQSTQDELRAFTERAMNGELPLEAIYAERLERIRPSRSQIESLAQAYIENTVDDAHQVIARLHDEGIHCGVVSGGIRSAILPLAASLGIAPEAVHAVEIRFDASGEYLDFDRTSPLARAGGKPSLIRAHEGWERPICFVGDGITDLETRPEVEIFVGFGGVARRPAVVAGATHFIDGPSLRPLLDHLDLR